MTEFANPQEEIWGGPKGDRYAKTYLLTPEQLDRKWIKAQTGVAKSNMNTLHLLPVPRDAKILEVGCNVGNQLVMLKEQGWKNVTGVELNRSAVAAARARGLNVKQGNALGLRHGAGMYDLVYTCWVLGHIAPKKNLERAMDEIYRVSRRWISGCEPFDAIRKFSVVRAGYLWKGDFCGHYLRRFPGIRVVNRQVYQNPRVPKQATEMFLLEKPQGGKE